MTKLVRIFTAASRPEFKEYIARANVKYLYWDDVRFRDPAPGLNHAESWTALKHSRSAFMKELPLEDEKGKPFKYWLPEGFQAILHEVDKSAAGSMVFDDTEHLSLFRESKDQILISSLMDEAIATSQIEGAITTRDQAKILLRDEKKPVNKSEQMIVNSYRTIRMIREVVDEPLSIDLLHRIQKEITADTLEEASKAGSFRTEKDSIVVADESSQKTLFLPPNAKLLTKRVQKLVDFANRKNSEATFVHPLVKAAILHFWLAYEHPYCDGNGRTARALFYWYMLKSGYGLFEYLTISRVVHQSPAKYYRSFLHSEYDDNDMTYSIAYMMRVTQASINQLRKLLKEKQEESRQMSAGLRNFPGLNYRQREILKHAVRHLSHRYTIGAHQASHGVSYQTARMDLLDLAEQGLFEQSLSGKQLVFFPARDLKRRLK